MCLYGGLLGLNVYRILEHFSFSYGFYNVGVSDPYLYVGTRYGIAVIIFYHRSSYVSPVQLCASDVRGIRRYVTIAVGSDFPDLASICQRRRSVDAHLVCRLKVDGHELIVTV